MVRIILGVVVGFVVWTILWLGSDQVLRNLSRSWYGSHQNNLDWAILNETPFAYDSTILVIHLVRCVVITLMSGFLAAFIAGENRKTPLALGVLLLIVGGIFQVAAWNYLPIWYHAVFLLLLIPMTVIGGRLRSKV